MSLHLEHLDPRTRALMRSEVDYDIARGTFYLSNRLSDGGRVAYLPAFLDAIARGDADSLAAALVRGRFLNEYETSHRRGVPYVKAVPRDAHDVLAEGEYNRFYLRALCLRATEDNLDHLEIYRAKVVHVPRWDSEARIGKLVQAHALLKDLREHTGVDTALGLPNGPNSGLSARIPARVRVASWG